MTPSSGARFVSSLLVVAALARTQDAGAAQFDILGAPGVVRAAAQDRALSGDHGSAGASSRLADLFESSGSGGIGPPMHHLGLLARILARPTMTSTLKRVLIDFGTGDGELRLVTLHAHGETLDVWEIPLSPKGANTPGQQAVHAMRLVYVSSAQSAEPRGDDLAALWCARQGTFRRASSSSGPTPGLSEFSSSFREVTTGTTITEPSPSAVALPRLHPPVPRRQEKAKSGRSALGTVPRRPRWR